MDLTSLVTTSSHGLQGPYLTFRIYEGPDFERGPSFFIASTSLDFLIKSFLDYNTLRLSPGKWAVLEHKDTKKQLLIESGYSSMWFVV